MNVRLLLVFFMVIFFSCDEDIKEAEREYSTEINFDVSTHLFPGESIKQIEFVDNGFYYSIGSKIYLADQTGSTIRNYTADSDVLSLEFNPKDESLYFGTNSSGLGMAKGVNIQYFTVENSGLPRNLIRQVQFDERGNIWFNASEHMIGGLVK